MSVEDTLASLGITLPTPGAPVAAYVPTVITGSTLYVSGQLPIGMEPLPIGQLAAADHVDGAVPEGSRLAHAQAAARQCAINLIAQAKIATGDLERIARVVKLTGFVNSDASFQQQHLVVNGASQLLLDAFGDKGKHARSAVGVAALPFGVIVEVEGIFEIA
ncbi:MAG: RidA family protein [Pseudomonadota bacterium]